MGHGRSFGPARRAGRSAEVEQSGSLGVPPDAQVDRSGSIGVGPGGQDWSSSCAGSAQECPGVRRGDPNRHQVAPRSDKRQSLYALLVRELSLGRIFDEMGRFSALPLRLRTLKSTAPATKNEDSAHRDARGVARTTLPRKTTKIECKIGPKSIEVGHSGYIEAPKSIEVGRSRSVEAPKSIEVGRSRPGRSSWHDDQGRATIPAR